MTRIACSRASSDIAVYYVSPLVGTWAKAFFSLLFLVYPWTDGLVEYNK